MKLEQINKIKSSVGVKNGPNVKHDHGPIRVLKGPQGTTHSMVPLRDQDLDPKSRVQNVVPE